MTDGGTTDALPFIDPLDSSGQRIDALERKCEALEARLDAIVQLGPRIGPVAPPLGVSVDVIRERARLAELLRQHARSTTSACDAWYQAAEFVARGGRP